MVCNGYVIRTKVKSNEIILYGILRTVITPAGIDFYDVMK